MSAFWLINPRTNRLDFTMTAGSQGGGYYQSGWHRGFFGTVAGKPFLNGGIIVAITSGTMNFLNWTVGLVIQEAPEAAASGKANFWQFKSMTISGIGTFLMSSATAGTPYVGSDGSTYRNWDWFGGTSYEITDGSVRTVTILDNV